MGGSPLPQLCARQGDASNQLCDIWSELVSTSSLRSNESLSLFSEDCHLRSKGAPGRARCLAGVATSRVPRDDNDHWAHE